MLGEGIYKVKYEQEVGSFGSERVRRRGGTNWRLSMRWLCLFFADFLKAKVKEVEQLKQDLSRAKVGGAVPAKRSVAQDRKTKRMTRWGFWVLLSGSGSRQG